MAVLSTSIAEGGLSLHPSVFVLNWMLCSSIVILFNKWILSAGFMYPILLTTWHLLVATLLTQLLAHTTTLVDGRKSVRMTGRMYLRAIVPIGVFYSMSLAFSNLVYLYLSVAFTQMLKAGAPATVLLTSWIFGAAKPNLSVLLNILVIVGGVAIASYGEIDFDMRGFLYQIGGLLSESIRLVLVQKLMSGSSTPAPKPTASVPQDGIASEKEDLEEGLEPRMNERAAAPVTQGPVKMDPLVSLYYFAPVCALMNLIGALIIEVPTFKMEDFHSVGALPLLANAGVAFFLNIASLLLIGQTSSLVLTLCGVLKNILIIFSSVLIWETPITSLQVLGYGIALVALTYYSIGWNDIVRLFPWVEELFTGTKRPQTILVLKISALFVAVLVGIMVWREWAAGSWEGTV